MNAKAIPCTWNRKRQRVICVYLNRPWKQFKVLCTFVWNKDRYYYETGMTNVFFSISRNCKRQLFFNGAIKYETSLFQIHWVRMGYVVSVHENKILRKDIRGALQVSWNTSQGPLLRCYSGSNTLIPLNLYLVFDVTNLLFDVITFTVNISPEKGYFIQYNICEFHQIPHGGYDVSFEIF